MIDHLVVSVKGPHRLNASSHILFLQNGPGMLEAINEEIFTEKATQPSYTTGVISHRVTLNAPFDITRTGFAAISLGPVPQTKSDIKATKSSYLLNALLLIL
ncbi:2-dehydropantoate 2-reductase (Ketopantoate reductase) (KPA reductase) (KPR) [Fusarium oxysporum]|nr:2-dehydropantoate 2-reductase (Ketopantoate reductase) (KPA reductase) (KPR) [Fusarium oxysporum]KAJ4267839.1 2-dehydropantoate 2-reductase (Ketopantoate reductase) (KPA reductase) (KPR) [Fusarium oxysporum]